VRQIHGQVAARGDVLGRGANAKIHGGALLVGFPEAVSFERLRNPDQLDGTGRAFASRKLHKKRRLKFEAAFAGARGLRQRDCAEHDGGGQLPRGPMKSVHKLIIAKHASGESDPDGLAGYDIPLSARIMTVADCYDALRSKRCYKDTHSHEESRDLIVNSIGNQFDPDVIRVFNSVENEFRRVWENAT